jgi:hypothetical protein
MAGTFGAKKYMMKSEVEKQLDLDFGKGSRGK